MKDERYRVLLVEDNELDQEAFQRFVEENDIPYNYTIADSVAEATVILTAKRFDVILLDYLLGDGTAFDLLGLNIKAPIILITGAGGEEIAVKAMKSDAYDYLIKDSKRNYLKILPTTVENVINRKKAEDAFRESEEKYRTLVENIRDGVFILQGTPYPDIIFYNKAFARMVGYTVEEMRGLAFQQYVAPEDLKRATDYYRQRLAGADLPREFEFRVLHQDGKTRVHVSMNTGRIKYQGKAACIGTVKDITERKLAEGTLRESEEKYRVLIENANEAIVVVQDGLFKLANPKIKELTGYSEAELKNKPFVEIIYQEDQKMVVERYHRRLEVEEVPHIYPIRIVNKEGNIKWIEVNAVVFPCKGRPATLGFLSDISERKKAEEGQ